ncbi:LamG-like jellyroll fold domain-containing protein [Embleya sp. NPDC055664]
MGETDGRKALVRVLLLNRHLQHRDVAEHYAARAAATQLTKVTLPSGRTHAEVAYDARTDRVTQVTDVNGGAWKLSQPTYTASSAAYASAVTASTPVAYYRIGEQNGTTARNTSGNAGPGTYHEVIPGRAGAFAGGDDTAAEFNGTTSWVELPQNLLRTMPRLSLELWFKTDKPGVILGHPDGSMQTLYLDGTKTGTVNGAVNQESSSRVYLGAGFATGRPEAPGTANRFDGSIDEVAVYDRAIDASAVTEHFAARSAAVPNTAPAYRAAVTSSGPWSYYRLNETSGARVDSQQGTPGTNGAGRAHDTTGYPVGTTEDEGSADFNGTTSYIELPQGLIHGSSQATIELSFRTSTPGVLFAGIGEPQTTYTPALYVDTDGKLRGKFFTTSGTALPQIVTEASVTDDYWHHVVLTTDGLVHTLYLDGVAAGTISGAVFHERSLRNFIGAGTTAGYEKAPPGDGHFYGQIDEVAVYRKSLDATTAAAHASAAQDLAADYRRTILASGPTGYWPLTLTDSATAPIDLVPGPATDAAGAWDVRQGVVGAFGPGGDRAAGFDGTASNIRLPKDQLTGVPQFTVEMWFQAEGPGVLMGYSTQELPYTNPDTPATPMLYVGTDGQLRGEVWNGTPAPITSPESVLDGRWHHLALSVDTPGKTLVHTVYGVPTAINAATAAYFVFDRVFEDLLPPDDSLRLRVYQRCVRALRAAHGGQAVDIAGHTAAMDAAVTAHDASALPAGIEAAHRFKTGVPARCSWGTPTRARGTFRELRKPPCGRTYGGRNGPRPGSWGWRTRRSRESERAREGRGTDDRGRPGDGPCPGLRVRGPRPGRRAGAPRPRPGRRPRRRPALPRGRAGPAPARTRRPPTRRHRRPGAHLAQGRGPSRPPGQRPPADRPPRRARVRLPAARVRPGRGGDVLVAVRRRRRQPPRRVVPVPQTPQPRRGPRRRLLARPGPGVVRPHPGHPIPAVHTHRGRPPAPARRRPRDHPGPVRTRRPSPTAPPPGDGDAQAARRGR